MSAAENIVPLLAPLEVTLHGSRELRRTLEVERTQWGTILARVRPQQTRRKRGDYHPGWTNAFASMALTPARDGDVEIVHHRHGSINLWLGQAGFRLLPAEADELAAKFGFAVRRESAE